MCGLHCFGVGGTDLALFFGGFSKSSSWRSSISFLKGPVTTITVWYAGPAFSMNENIGNDLASRKVFIIAAISCFLNYFHVLYRGSLEGMVTRYGATNRCAELALTITERYLNSRFSIAAF